MGRARASGRFCLIHCRAATLFPRLLVESGYGGAKGLKWFIDQAHAHGLAVFMDVLYNHCGPVDTGAWQFDGWFEQTLASPLTPA